MLDDFTRQQTVEPLPDNVVLNDARKQTLLLPYAGQNGYTFVMSLKTHLKKTLLSNVKADIGYTNSPPRWNSPWPGEGAYPPRSFTQVRQRGELNWVSQLQPSGQPISSIIMARPESIPIRQD